MIKITKEQIKNLRTILANNGILLPDFRVSLRITRKKMPFKLVFCADNTYSLIDTIDYYEHYHSFTTDFTEVLLELLSDGYVIKTKLDINYCNKV